MTLPSCCPRVLAPRNSSRGSLVGSSHRLWARLLCNTPGDKTAPLGGTSEYQGCALQRTLGSTAFTEPAGTPEQGSHVVGAACQSFCAVGGAAFMENIPAWVHTVFYILSNDTF